MLWRNSWLIHIIKSRDRKRRWDSGYTPNDLNVKEDNQGKYISMHIKNEGYLMSCCKLPWKTLFDPELRWLCVPEFTCSFVHIGFFWVLWFPPKQAKLLPGVNERQTSRCIVSCPTNSFPCRMISLALCPVYWDWIRSTVTLTLIKLWLNKAKTSLWDPLWYYGWYSNGNNGGQNSKRM